MAVPSRCKLGRAFDWPGVAGRKRRTAEAFFSQIATVAETTSNLFATLSAPVLGSRIFRLGG